MKKAPSINNFPCEELRTIDKLWVDNSGGKFGFSVQKKVWLDCGGVLGENNWDVYKKFGDQVGWRRRGNWLSYDELTFYYEEVEHAHLPAWWQSGQGRGLMGKAVSFLAQRLVTCNIESIWYLL